MTSRMQHGNLNFRGLGDRNSYLSREVPFVTNILGTGNQLGSMWLADGERKNYPYILDWFYTLRPQPTSDTSRENPQPFDVIQEDTNDFWTSPQLRQKEELCDENQGCLYKDRAHNHLEASTSAPLFHESSVLRQHESSHVAHPTGSHWWARTKPPTANPETSFLEPPNFNHDRYDYYDNISDRSEQDHLDWRNNSSLSRTFIMDDLDGGGFNLPFGDIYGRQSDNSPDEDLDPSDMV